MRLHCSRSRIHLDSEGVYVSASHSDEASQNDSEAWPDYLKNQSISESFYTIRRIIDSLYGISPKGSGLSVYKWHIYQ